MHKVVTTGEIIKLVDDAILEVKAQQADLAVLEKHKAPPSAEMVEAWLQKSRDQLYLIKTTLRVLP